MKIIKRIPVYVLHIEDIVHTSIFNTYQFPSGDDLRWYMLNKTTYDNTSNINLQMSTVVIIGDLSVDKPSKCWYNGILNWLRELTWQ